MFRENIFDIVEDIEANGDPDYDENSVFSATIMTLPKGLTRTEVLFRVHGNRTGFRNLTKEAYEFEESYRVENRARWLRFLRLSVTVFLILKPFMTLYQTIKLANIRSFEESQLIFLLNFCIMYPVMLAFLLCSFSPTFSTWEQFASVIVISVVAVVLCTESLATNSLGHAYMSALALYQCYFANISFLLRVINGFEILTLYLVANLIIAPYYGWEVNATQLRVLRNALYIFMFFAGQAWVVFNSEFKQRINHYRDITLNSQKQKLEEEEARITKLLLNLLPETIVHKLKEDPQTTIADFFDNVTVLFTDMVNFTAYSSKVSAMELVQFLNDMYTRFDTIAEREVLYKVEIIGDAYFVVGGCPIVNTNNALAVVTAATDMFAALPLLRRNCGVPDLNIRIGVHSGPVLAGVVGSKDPRYHLFGDTVSIAHFLESSGVPGRIHISESTWASMNKETPGHGFKVEYHTLLSINGSSKKLRTYFVL
ncbi:Guanylate cyclase [Phytophthora palmivora]|uniref:Guanylate cyclase n=1 Tax=Phytophthora palmivora TaxID=4796 RepID=A0A2P4XEN9_9STRA|nr:Guanylate cyclase [Phytophthora palmivora]